MKIVNFSQRSEDWIKWRKNGIGATDISVIMGSNPFKTQLQLWETKCGFKADDEPNEAMLHGMTHEDSARQWLNDNMGLRLSPICVEDNDVSYFRASIDGYDYEHETLVEIKCPVSEKIIERARVAQAVPDYWLDQIYWQIMITCPKRAMIAIWDYRVGGCITIEIYPSKTRVNSMRKKAEEFWRSVMIGKPPAATEKDFLQIEDVYLTEMLLEHKELVDKIKALEERKAEVRLEIEKFADKGNFVSSGFKVQKYNTVPTYDIEAMRQAGILVDLYKKTPKNPQYIKILSVNSTVSDS